MIRKWLVVLGVTLFWSIQAGAVPILRLVLTGNAANLGSGGIEPFANSEWDALHLTRPALLSLLSKPLLRLEVANENTIRLDGPQFFGGTRAYQQDATVIAALPLDLNGFRVTLLASGQMTRALLRIQDETDGVVTHINQNVSQGSFGVAFDPWKRVHLGAAVFAGSQPGFAGEILVDLGQVQFGVQQRREQLAYSLVIPTGPPARLRRPEIDYRMGTVRDAGILSAQIKNRWTDSAFSMDVVNGDPILDTAVYVGNRLTLRGHFEQTHLSFDDWAFNKGVPVARINLDMLLARWALGAEVQLGLGRLVLRLGQTSLATASNWVDNGEITGMQFFALPINLGLSLEQMFRARATQWSIGWNWSFAPLQASLGVQHLHLHNDAGGYSYGSSVDVSLGGRHVFAPSEFEATAFTGGISCALGRTTLHVAIAQVIPITGPPGGVLAKPTPAAPSGPSGGSDAPKPTTDGGRLLSFDVNQSF